MFSSFEWMVALRYLRARRSDGFISVIAGFSLLGICLGVATLIIVMAVMNGFREELLSRILGVNGHVTVAGYGGRLDDFDRVADRVRGVEGVVSATPLIQGQVMATNRGRASGAVVRGVRAEALRGHELIGQGVVTGSLDDFGPPGTIALGHRLARNLGVAAGDRLTLVAPEGTSTPFGTAPRLRGFDVVATFDVGVFQYDNAFVFMPLDDAQVYFRLEDAVSQLEVFTTDPDRIDPIRAGIVDAVGEDGFVSDWRQFNESLFTALVVERNVMFLILTLIIIVAAFNIISSLIMLVKDKARDVAIMRTMGASQGSVMRIFVIAGASIGVVGTLLGFGLGVLFCLNIEAIREFLQLLTGTDLWNPEIRFLSEIPASMDPMEVGSTVVVALLLSLLATLPPASRAARLDPVEVLRYE